MSGLKELLGENVIDKKGNKVDISTLGGAGKSLGIYFSAHWCPPCRAFTPQLAEFYKKMKETPKGKDMDIIFVSSDKDQKSFDEYYGEMPWLALNFEEREKKNELSKKFKVEGIPTLATVDGNGKLITNSARAMVADDPEGKGWPWQPKPFAEVFSGDLIKADKSPVSTDSLRGKIKGIYFSAHWCPPCRGFTPKLIETYKKLKEAGKDFEFVFVSSDRDQAAFDEYFGTMPWLAVPFGDDRKNSLSRHFEVNGIPTFVMLDGQDQVITTDGRAAVSGDPEGKEFPWYKKQLNELTGDTASAINDSKALLVFTDGSEGEIAKAKAALEPAANKYYNKFGDQDMYFYYAGEDDIVESLCGFIKIENKPPMIIVTDIGEGKTYTCDSSDVTADVISKFADDVVNNKISGVAFR